MSHCVTDNNSSVIFNYVKLIVMTVQRDTCIGFVQTLIGVFPSVDQKKVTYGLTPLLIISLNYYYSSSEIIGAKLVIEFD